MYTDYIFKKFLYRFRRFFSIKKEMIYKMKDNKASHQKTLDNRNPFGKF